MKTTVSPDKIETVWIGDEGATDLMSDLYIEQTDNIDEAVGMIKENLQDKRIIFRPW